eukprot:symbB.v1.2.000646.t1/scaffold7.1/size571927/14
MFSCIFKMFCRGPAVSISTSASAPASSSFFQKSRQIEVDRLACAAALVTVRRALTWRFPRRHSHRIRGHRADVTTACRATTEVQGDFISCLSMAPTWEDAVEEVAQEVGPGFEAAFVFFSELYVDQAQGIAPMMEKLRERLDVEHLVGGAAGGSIGRSVGKMATDYAAGEGVPTEVERGFVLSVAAIRNAGAVPFFLSGDAGGDLELINRPDGVVQLTFQLQASRELLASFMEPKIFVSKFRSRKRSWNCEHTAYLTDVRHHVQRFDS